MRALKAKYLIYVGAHKKKKETTYRKMMNLFEFRAMHDAWQSFILVQFRDAHDAWLN